MSVGFRLEPSAVPAVGQLWADLDPRPHRHRRLRLINLAPPNRVVFQVVRIAGEEQRFPDRRVVRVQTARLRPTRNGYDLLEECRWQPFYLDLGCGCLPPVQSRLERIRVVGSQGRYIDSPEDWRDIVLQAGVAHHARFIQARQVERQVGMDGPQGIPRFVVWPAPGSNRTKQTLRSWSEGQGMDLDWVPQGTMMRDDS